MSVGKYSANNPLSDLISLEGSFVSSFLGDMPPIAVKTYVYLVFLCNHPEIKINSLVQFAQTLNCSATDINSSMEYLKKLHLINYTSRPFSFEILSATIASQNTGLYNADSLTAYADYFAGIRALFPGRSINNVDYDKARDWVEIYGLSVETALLLISHCINLKDSNISFNYIDKIALSWANDGIKTLEKAEEYLTLEQAKSHDVAKLLVHLGIKRTPTMDEIALYQRWTSELGFDLKAIKAACQETTKSLNPSLAYINRILETLHSLDLHHEKQIKVYLSESDNEKRLISVILFELGEKSRTITQNHTSVITKYKNCGFTQDMLIFVARKMCENGLHTFTKYTAKLEELNTQSIYKQQEIAKFFEHTNKTEEKPAKNNFKGRSESYGADIFADTSKLEV